MTAVSMDDMPKNYHEYKYGLVESIPKRMIETVTQLTLFYVAGYYYLTPINNRLHSMST